MSTQRVRINSAEAKRILVSSEVKNDFERRIKAIADACTSESSWGGYFTATTVSGDRVSSKMWSLSSNLSEDHERHQRMIRNLDAGS